MRHCKLSKCRFVGIARSDIPQWFEPGDVQFPLGSSCSKVYFPTTRLKVGLHIFAILNIFLLLYPTQEPISKLGLQKVRQRTLQRDHAQR